MKYILPSIIICLLTISCQINTENRNSEKQKIGKVISDQQHAWNSGDIERYMQGYSKTDSLRFASGGNVSYGWQATFNRYQKGYPEKETMGELIFSDIDIELISPQAAIVFGKWELERETDHPWGLFTLVFKKTDDGWRIVHDHTSSAKR